MIGTRKLLACMAAGAVLAGGGTGYARADVGADYAADNAARICITLDSYPSFGGIMGIAQAIVNEGQLSYYDAGRAIAVSVAVVCPQHQRLINQFIVSQHGRVV